MIKDLLKNRASLLVIDLFLLASSFSFSFYIRTSTWEFNFLEHPFWGLSFFIYPLSLYIFDLYFPYRQFRWDQTLADVVMSVSVSGLLLASCSYLDRSFLFSRSIFLSVGFIFATFIFISRLFYEWLIQTHLLDKRALIIGTGHFAKEVRKKIVEVPGAGIEILGFISVKKKNSSDEENYKNISIAGHASSLLSLIDWHRADLLILALDSTDHFSETEILTHAFKKNTGVISGIALYENLSGEIPYRALNHDYLIGLMSYTRVRTYLRVKRAMDVLISGCLLIGLFPIFALSVLGLYLNGFKNPIFIQKRIGQSGKNFRLIKLRTMKENHGNKSQTTFLSRAFRKYRVDEVPQLINVLKGDMSLIGPRPEIPFFVERCRKKIPFYDAVFTVKPGLTGWAQVKFRHATSVKDYEQKFRYNLYYLKNISLKLDFVILLQTIRVVLQGKGK